MKRLVVAVMLSLCAGGCMSPDIHREIVGVRELHAEYRASVKPKFTKESDKEKVEELGKNIDLVLEHLEGLTK